MAIRQTKSVLEFNASASDNGAVYACSAFSPKTMNTPLQSALSTKLNVTCKFIIYVSFILGFVNNLRLNMG